MVDNEKEYNEVLSKCNSIPVVKTSNVIEEKKTKEIIKKIEVPEPILYTRIKLNCAESILNVMYEGMLKISTYGNRVCFECPKRNPTVHIPCPTDSTRCTAEMSNQKFSIVLNHPKDFDDLKRQIIKVLFCIWI